jgi:hypothetical protein
MTKNPIVITSLEEDFRKIGLIKGSLTESKVEETEVEADESEIEEAARIKKRLVGGKVQRTQKSSMKQRMAGKKYRRSAAGKAMARKRKLKMKKPSFLRRMKRLMAKAIAKGTRKESMDISPIFGRLAEATHDNAEALKSFANAAIIAEKLSAYFDSWVESVEDEFENEAEGLADISTYFESVAEMFAAVATNLSEGRTADTEAMSALFNEHLDAILDGVELYEGMYETDVEDEETDDEGEEMDDEEMEMSAKQRGK